MKKEAIGILFDEQEKLGEEEKIFINLAKKKKIKLVMINTSKDINEEEIKIVILSPCGRPPEGGEKS